MNTGGTFFLLISTPCLWGFMSFRSSKESIQQYFLDDEDLSAGTKLNSEEEYTDEDYADMYAEQQLNEMRGK